jgi:hypothetical protein
MHRAYIVIFGDIGHADVHLWVLDQAIALIVTSCTFSNEMPASRMAAP